MLPIKPDDQSSIAPLKRATKADVAAAQNADKIRSIRLKGKLATWNAYTGFFVSKGLGVLAMVGGGLDWLSPDLLHLHLAKPGFVAGAGIAMLTGKTILSLIAKAERVVK